MHIGNRGQTDIEALFGLVELLGDSLLFCLGKGIVFRFG